MAETLSVQLMRATLPEVTAEEFNILITGLKQLPYVVSQPLIDRFREHVKTQMENSNALER
jgi:hypothetical protein